MTTEVIMPTSTTTQGAKTDRKPRGKPHAAVGPKRPFVPTKKSNDHVYEAKRAEYEKNLNAIETDVKILKPKLVTPLTHCISMCLAIYFRVV